MFDCGMHMGHLDHQRYPDFSLIPKPEPDPNFDHALTCIIITHLYEKKTKTNSNILNSLWFSRLTSIFVDLLQLGSHLDHVGALPYFTEVCGYRGPIYMTVRCSGKCLCQLVF